MFDDYEVGSKLRNVRESRSWSRKDVENMTGGEIKESILAMYENGHRRIPSPRLKRLADFYGVTVGFLMGEGLPRTDGAVDIRAILMSDPNYSDEEKKLLLDVVEIIQAKRRAEGKA